MTENQIKRRMFLSSVAALIGVKVSEVPMDTGAPSHWLSVACRFLPRFQFFVRR